jgi:hypothetical protein
VSGKGGDVARFLEEHEERISRLELESHEGYWESATTGSEEASERYARAVGGHPQAVRGSGRCGARPRLAAGRG